MTSRPELGSVLITTPSFGQHSRQPWEALADSGVIPRGPAPERPPRTDELLAEVAGADALIVGNERVDAAVLDNAPSLKVVARHGSHAENVDLAAARRHGIRVVHAPGANTGAVADFTLGLMLAGARGIVAAHTDRQQVFGPELSERTLGLFGFGKIGQAVARRARGFGMTVIAYDPYLPKSLFSHHGVEPVDMLDCVTGSDVLSLHIPSNRVLLGRDELRRTKPGAYLLNTARDGLVDKHALAELLHSGHLSGAAVDVSDPAPVLTTAPNLVLTPRIAALSHEANTITGTTIAEDVARVLRGESPRHEAT